MYRIPQQSINQYFKFIIIIPICILFQKQFHDLMGNPSMFVMSLIPDIYHLTPVTILGCPFARFSDASKGIETGIIRWWWECKGKGQTRSPSRYSSRCPKDVHMILLDKWLILGKQLKTIGFQVLSNYMAPSKVRFRSFAFFAQDRECDRQRDLPGHLSEEQVGDRGIWFVIISICELS